MKLSKKPFLFLIVASFILFSPQALRRTPAFAQPDATQRVDTTSLELDLAKRIESLIERLVGPGRAIAKVNLKIIEKPQAGIERKTESKGEETSQLKGIPGIIVSKPSSRPQPPQRITDLVRAGSAINKIYIKILVDDKLEAEKIKLIKETVPVWVGLDAARGDILDVESVPWSKIQLLPIEQLSVKQIEVGKKNIFVGLGIFLVLLILAGVIVALVIGIIKLPRAKTEHAGQEPGMAGEAADRITGSIDKLAKELGGLQGTGGAAGGKIDGLLQDIKEILSRPQQQQAAAANATTEAQAPAEVKQTAALEIKLNEISGLLKKQLLGEKPMDRPFEYINAELSAAEVIKLTDGKNEDVLIHIVANVDPKKSAEILSSLPDEKRLEVFSKVAAITQTTPDIVQRTKELLETKLKEIGAGATTAFTSSELLSKILSASPDEVTHSVLDRLRKDNPALADETRKKIFLFEDIATLDNKPIGLILNNIDRNLLKLALKHSAQAILDKIFSAMSERGAAILKEDLDIMADVSDKSSKNAQVKILEKIRELERTGVISLKRS